MYICNTHTHTYIVQYYVLWIIHCLSPIFILGAATPGGILATPEACYCTTPRAFGSAGPALGKTWRVQSPVETMGKLWENEDNPEKWVAMGINGILIHFNGADTQPLGQRSNRLRPQYSNWNQSQVNDSSLAFTQRKRGFTEAMLSIPLTEVSLSAPYSQTHPKFERSWTIIF